MAYLFDSDVLSAHKAVAMAQLNYIEQMRDYDKAQLRLLVLLGGACNVPTPATPAPAPSGR